MTPEENPYSVSNRGSPAKKREAKPKARLQQKLWTTRSEPKLLSHQYRLVGCADDQCLQDDIARCLLSPQHYIALQKALLPQFFRNGRLPPLPEADADAGGDARDHEMAPAGIAAVGRAALDVGG